MNKPVRIDYQKPDFDTDEVGLFDPAGAVTVFREFDWDAGLAEMARREEANDEFCSPQLLFYREDLPDNPYFSIFPDRDGSFGVQVAYRSTRRFLGMFPPRTVYRSADKLISAQVQNALERYVLANENEMDMVVQ
jgi:hypothetical protein